METNPYRRVVATTSMTTAERAQSKRIRRQINRGEEPTEVMARRGPPRRPGLRGYQYAYTNEDPPMRVVPHEDRMTDATEEVSVPRLSNHEDLATTSINNETATGSSVQTYYIIGVRPDPPVVHNYYTLPNRPESPVPDGNEDEDEDETESNHTSTTDRDSEVDSSSEDEGNKKDGDGDNRNNNTGVQQLERFGTLAMLAEQAVEGM
ncbi:hypothetical protein FRC09_004711 [Ceratobasidium sp. 395]|nr:hypothetical protein FRC09_004711 [Ceratobasidium sp. 395]